MRGKNRKRSARIVSKEVYAARVAAREAKRWGSVAMAFTVGACFVATMICGMGTLFAEEAFWKAICALVAVASFFLGASLMRCAEKTMQEALVELDVVPLTRTNEADLLPYESLSCARPAKPHFLLQ